MSLGTLPWFTFSRPSLKPYVDLFRGDAPAEHSLLLDYTRTKYVYFVTCLHISYCYRTAISSYGQKLRKTGTILCRWRH